MPQILGYVTPAERDAFRAYAQGMGLDATALANLLIARELRAKRLATQAPASTAAGAMAERVKIVAHVPTEAIKAAFAAYAAQTGMKPSRLAALLFRMELEERWLERHVLVNQFDSA
ncbi:hypothetical protein [Phenylobacterium sp.]|uniref:hypothetical protein n=1 Tax=Phenylobacterium sp. TaxID=1871053 RepID=UPI00391B10B7